MLHVEQQTLTHGLTVCAELMEGPVGYDMSHAVWHNEGWREMRDLRKKLENLKELRDLIKKLGRASGKGPKRRAPQEVRPRSFVVGHAHERRTFLSMRLFCQLHGS